MARGLPGASAGLVAAQRKAAARVEPLNVMLELSVRCNLRCVHCYNFDRNSSRAPRAGAELTTAEIAALLPQLRREGCLFLGLTGGEPFVHPDLFDIIKAAGHLGMAVRLLSSGTMLAKATVDRLASCPNVIGIDLSLYGATPAVHDLVTRLPGSHRRTWEAARSLHEAGLVVMLKYVIMKPNMQETALMMEHAKKAGLPFKFTTVLFGRYDGTNGSLDQRLNSDDLERLYRGPLQSLVPSGRPSDSPSDFMCNCARGNCAISAQGDVYPCISVPLSAGNIRHQSFRDIWRHSPLFKKIRGLQLADFPACSGCADRPWCRHPRGASYLASGSYVGVDPWICQDARIVRHLSEEGHQVPSAELSGRGLRARAPGRALKGTPAVGHLSLTP